MLIGVPLETAAGETRVAVTPETAKKLVAQGHTLRIQSGAGLSASVTDEAYVAAGAEITDAMGGGSEEGKDLKPYQMVHIYSVRQYMQVEFHPDAFAQSLPFEYVCVCACVRACVCVCVRACVCVCSPPKGSSATRFWLFPAK